MSLRVGLVLFISLLNVRAEAADVEALIDSGSTKLQQNQFAAAVSDFANAAKLAPKDPRPVYLDGEALAKWGKAADAEREFRRALKMQPSLYVVQGELGALLLEQNRYADAATELSLAAKRAPNGSVYFNLAKAELGQKNCKGALAAFGQATHLSPADVDTWLGRSAAERTCNALPAAKISAATAVHLAPSRADAQANLGLVLAHLDENQAAFDALTRATKLDDQAAAPFWTLGIVTRRLSQWDASIAALQKSIALKPSPDKTVDLGVTYAKAGRLSEAEKQFRAALAQNPAAPSPRFRLVQILCAQKQPQKAETEAAQLPADVKNSPKVRALLDGCK